MRHVRSLAGEDGTRAVLRRDMTRRESRAMVTNRTHPSAPVQTERRSRIRVWFGNEVICSHVADPVEAERYATLMARRFAGLAVTIDDEPGPNDPELPHRLLWEQTVR